MQNVNSGDFNQEVIQSKIPVVIDAYAVWCAPCRSISPIFEELGKEFDGRIKFVKMDIDANQDFASDHKIMSIPAFLVFKDGKEVYRKIGVFNKDSFKKDLDNLI